MTSREQLRDNWEKFEKFLHDVTNKGMAAAMQEHAEKIMHLQIIVPNLVANTEEIKTVADLTPEDFELIADFQQVLATEAEVRRNFWADLRANPTDPEEG